MADAPDRFREEAKEVAQAAHGAARDDKDMRSDRITAKLLGMVDRLQRDVMEHMVQERVTVNELKEGLARVERKVEEFVTAFPGGDAVQHRLEHEARMKKAAADERFWSNMRFTFWAIVLTGTTGWLFVVVWHAFLQGPKG